MPRVFSYSACGLTIVSDAPIAGLHAIAADRPTDLAISMCGLARPPRPDLFYPSILYVSPELDSSGRPELTIESGSAGYRLTYCDDTTFLIDATGNRVDVRWVSPLNAEDAASYLTGSVLGFILRLRGSVPLHASAVAIDGRALLFVGDSWAGKSSTAAAFTTLGYPLLSDDIVRIDGDEDTLIAYPSHPRLNVWSDSAEALYGTPEGLPLHSDTHRKHYLDLLDAGYPFQTTSVPIEAIYLLGERATGQSLSVRPTPPRLALITLVLHTYGNCLLDGPMRAREFDVLGRLVDRVPVRELRFGDNLRDLVSSCRELADGCSMAAGQR